MAAMGVKTNTPIQAVLQSGNDTSQAMYTNWHTTNSQTTWAQTGAIARFQCCTTGIALKTVTNAKANASQ